MLNIRVIRFICGQQDTRMLQLSKGYFQGIEDRLKVIGYLDAAASNMKYRTNTMAIPAYQCQWRDIEKKESVVAYTAELVADRALWDSLCRAVILTQTIFI